MPVRRKIDPRHLGDTLASRGVDGLEPPRRVPGAQRRPRKPGYEPFLRWRRSVAHVSVYSGPLPPSGTVSRPPFAVIAPHCTQFDGVTDTSTRPSSSVSSETS